MKGGPWFMVYIDAVHYEKNIYGFEVISHLKWTNTLSQPATNICTKSELIDFIKKILTVQKLNIIIHGKAGLLAKM